MISLYFAIAYKMANCALTNVLTKRIPKPAKINGAASQRTRKFQTSRPSSASALASMGPRHRGRGNVYGYATLTAQVNRLQWGRVTEDAEILLIIEFSFLPIPASMGPRHRGRGNKKAVGGRKAKGRASMGPRHRGRGNRTFFELQV